MKAIDVIRSSILNYNIYKNDLIESDIYFDKIHLPDFTFILAYSIYSNPILDNFSICKYNLITNCNMNFYCFNDLIPNEKLSDITCWYSIDDYSFFASRSIKYPKRYNDKERILTIKDNSLLVSELKNEYNKKYKQFRKFYESILTLYEIAGM